MWDAPTRQWDPTGETSNEHMINVGKACLSGLRAAVGIAAVAEAIASQKVDQVRSGAPMFGPGSGPDVSDLLADMGTLAVLQCVGNAGWAAFHPKAMTSWARIVDALDEIE